MRCATVVTLLYAVGAIGNICDAQQRPNLAGTWITATTGAATRQDIPAKPSAVGRNTRQLTITQNGRTITVSDGRLTDTYALDGSEVVNRVRIAGRLADKVTRAHWEGDELVVVGKAESAGGPRVETIRMSIAPNGSLRLHLTNTGKTGNIVANMTYTRSTSTIP
jgi:hypothetical protein